ncbi:MAG: hypothetical protein K6G08_04355 [Prevotella sp.]|nr:hypothetical protein [Prevotella sp.]
MTQLEKKTTGKGQIYDSRRAVFETKKGRLCDAGETAPRYMMIRLLLLLSAKHCNSLIGWQPALSLTKGMSGKFKLAKIAVRRDFRRSTALRVKKDSFLTRKAVLFRPRSCLSFFEELSM